MIKNIKKNKVLLIKLVIVLMLIFGIYKVFYDIDTITGGTYLSSVNSPDNRYILKAYFIDGGSLNGNGIRVELINSETKKIKNIYFNYPENDVKMQWIDKDTVIINDITLDINKTYDWRIEKLFN